MAQVYVKSLIFSFCILFIHSEVVKRSTCKNNEMFVECVHCGPKTCDELGYPIPCNGGTGLCNPECVCIDGFVRDANGTCIPKVECLVKRSTCKNNEMFVECVHCGPKTCDELGYPIPCNGGTGLCNPECVCIDGFVRDANGTCIPKVECPACGGDNNAMTGCGNHCGVSCSDYKENKTCLTGCRYNSCDCKPGHVYHEGKSRCVLKEDC